ncbi:hypothetical protein F4820DRAFT_447577 [Hypoxylon rubiginosum]|uniref:Uncharacterized protein n=1 Tax=Hypoxylon rubiginosum TaxID=110542 RepID=A0ACB9Z468_9PEZI|nr:hypothetical protein F4820DRAFT_447577 [Hypoxylon rubiginosum]
MAAVIAPFQSPIGGDLDRRNPIINYAFSRYQYVITPREAEEIVNRSYWENVDAFCSYMIAANFGEPIPGTKNVELPSTLTLYTDEELDAMEAELFNVERPVSERPNTNEASSASEADVLVDQESYLEDAPHTYITEEDLDFEVVVDEAEFDGEYLPLYTPEILPPYSPSDTTNPPSKASFVIQVEKPKDDPPEYSATVDTPEEDAPMEVDPECAIQSTSDILAVEDAPRNDSIEKVENEVCGTSTLAMLRSLGARVERKLQKAKRKLAHAISPKKTVVWVRETKKILRQR